MTGQFLKKMGALSAAAMALIPTLATAQEEAGYTAGHPLPGQFHLQRSVTPIMDSITTFHDGILMWTISLIVAFVLALLLWIVFRYNAKRNPVPAGFTHNTLVEIVWTVLPVVILIIIAIPSFGVLSDQLTTPDGERKYLGANIFSFGEVDVPAPELTIKATGVQWSWSYEYVDQELFVDSVMLTEEERTAQKPNQPRLLAVDNELVVPVDTTVRVQVTADPTASFTLSQCRPSASRSTRSPGASTRPGSMRARPASTTASAPNCAARTMPSCPSQFAWSPRKNSRPSSKRSRVATMPPVSLRLRPYSKNTGQGTR